MDWRWFEGGGQPDYNTMLILAVHLVPLQTGVKRYNQTESALGRPKAA
jgi:hypothetical protein